ncbi:hypothetical protein ACN4EG_14235 [Alkalinema pantanalense CENA528]|uniref:hypothetical protein n=1 Tax=Alkalinema pantanalense TaxID=1620705 RepID=UPI003D6E22BB
MIQLQTCGRTRSRTLSISQATEQTIGPVHPRVHFQMDCPTVQGMGNHLLLLPNGPIAAYQSFDLNHN